MDWTRSPLLTELQKQVTRKSALPVPPLMTVNACRRREAQEARDAYSSI
jgi:hypothetical protein